MIPLRLLLTCSILLSAPCAVGETELPTPTHYGLSYRVDLEGGTVQGEARIRLVNETGAAVDRVPFLLYRLFDVSEAASAGSSLSFESRVVKDADLPELQVNLVRVELERPLAPRGVTTVRLRFAGPLHGYPEVWAYVRESISGDYALLRDDSFAYPVVARANRASRHMERRFTYGLEVTVASTHTVATGGRLLGSHEADGFSTTRWESKVPVWRLDVAIAPFRVRRDEARGFVVYVLPGHEEGAERVLDAMQRTVELYTRLFGPAGNFQGYTAIEIPEGWGSQAGDLYFLQTAPAFEEADRLHEVYHEVAHNWNAVTEGEVQRCRFFDEAFASYFQALALRELQSAESYAADLERSRASFRRRADGSRLARETPIAEYGKHELGGLSYTKGAWSLYVLHELIGEKAFVDLVRRLLAESAPVDFESFRRIAGQVSERDLSRYFDEWIFGAESSRLLSGEEPIDRIVARYR